MQRFSVVYDYILRCASHKHALLCLMALSFAEASFFPIPPDVMLVPMVLACPHQALRYASLMTLASVLGGMLGYWVGAMAFGWVHPYIIKFGYEAAYIKLLYGFENWNFWILLLAGFTPLPYKLFTITAGALHVPLLPFIVGSLVGRGGRFFLVALVLRWRGASVDRLLRDYVDKLSWFLVVGVVVLFAYLRFVT